MKHLSRLSLILLLLLFATRCSKESAKPSAIDPAKSPDLLGKALVIDNATNKSGSAPTTTTTSGTPTITNSQSSASVTANSKIFIPFTFTSTSGLAGIYLYVDNSGNYWDIKINSAVTNGQVVLPVGIPANVLKGDFTIYYSIYTTSGLVSAKKMLMTEVVDLSTACTGTVSESGSDGLTVRSYTYSKSGTININYDMYTLPDRMDIYVDGVWTAGTGSSLTGSQAPPASVCNDGANGYVSNTGTKVINYKAGQRIDVYLSGCFGGTAWVYNFNCPM